MRSTLFICFILLFTARGGYGQERLPKVELVGRVSDNSSISLRWAPDSPVMWQLANQYGYTIERVTITDNGIVLKEPIRTKLNETPILPAVESGWLGLMDNDDFVAVAAQAIFGESFELQQSNQGDISYMMNKAKELANRFSFALYAADMSIDAAQLSGLYFKDEQVYPNQKYLYKVYANIPQEILKSDTGIVYLGLENYKPLPQPQKVSAIFDDQSALISWDGLMLKKEYNAYWIERSENSINFQRLTDSPLIHTNKDKQDLKRRMIYYVDSLPNNGVEYHYRIIGINAFGELGPASDTVSGRGLPAFEYSANIERHSINENEVLLEWSFPPGGEKNLKSFDLLKKNPRTKEFAEVVLNLSPDHRLAVDSATTSSNYYVIRSNDQYGRSTFSFPYFVQLEDSIPPSIPTGFTGVIDTSGIVHLRWDPSPETDVFGYKIYRRNFKSNDFIALGGEIITDTVFTDTLQIKTLTKSIYYGVQALDHHFNPSDISADLELKKPDLIPPLPPVFRTLKSDSLGIRIMWESSPSTDVVEYLLYRRSEKESEWSLIKNLGLDNSPGYYDQSVEPNVKYQYTMLAIDDSGLESEPAIPMLKKFVKLNPYPEVEDLFHFVDKSEKSLTVRWEYEIQNVRKFIIYKRINDGQLMQFKSVDGSISEITDQYKDSHELLEYRVMAIFDAGITTGIRRKVKIELL